VKQLHCTSRLGFNFSYSVPLKKSDASLNSSGSVRCRAFIAGAFSPFFHSETIKGVGFVTLS
jgi:hypothetical protein